MKVLHIIDSLGVGGGAEHSLANLLPYLRDRGVESTVVTIRPRVGGLQARLVEEGFTVTVLPRSSARERTIDLARHIRSERPDLVHATLFNSCLLSRFACRGSHIPLINSLVSTSYDMARMDGIGVRRWKLATVRGLDAVTARHLVTRVHAVNQAVAQEAIEVLKVDPRRVTVIPRGRSRAALGEWSAERRAAARERLGVGPETPLVLNVGRQVHAKAQTDLIAGFAHVLENVPEAVLVIAGREGDASDAVRAALAKLARPQQVRLLGHRTDVADLYVAADVMAFPSLYEGAAGGIIEAMALGCPVVGSDAPGVVEVLGHGRLGPVVPRRDPVALGREIESLLAKPRYREELRFAGIEEFMKRYSMTSVADATMTMYHHVARGEQ